MIDWKRRCLQLAKLVDLHRRERMLNDEKAAWELAQIILELSKQDDKMRAMFMKYWREPNKKKAKEYYTEYLGMVRWQNSRLESLDQSLKDYFTSRD